MGNGYSMCSMLSQFTISGVHRTNDTDKWMNCSRVVVLGNLCATREAGVSIWNFGMNVFCTVGDVLSLSFKFVEFEIYSTSASKSVHF